MQVLWPPLRDNKRGLGKRGAVGWRRMTPGRVKFSNAHIAMLALLPSLAGCASSQPDFAPEPRAGLACVDDSRQCIDQRQAVLKGMMADRERRWVKEPASPQAYASGVRLFAFKGRKKEMSCDELAFGRREADAASTVLKGAGAATLTPAQISRSSMLAVEVSRELGIEMKKRCRA